MEKSELLTLAREYAKTEDLFDLLGIDALEADDEAKVRRAWRKASLKYHPDKVGGPTGDGFNDTMKAKWELLERAREILSDPATREAYTSARSAILIREQQRAAMDAKKRAMIEDLEARENGTAVKRRKRDDGKVAETEQEKQAAMERGRKRREERERLMREAEERERLRNPPVQEKKTKTGSAKQPSPQPQGNSGEGNPTTTEPDEDSRIADLEKRLEEVRQRKAAKKARKDKDASNTGVEEPTTTTATGENTTTAAPKPAPKRSAKMDALLKRLRGGKQGE